MELETKRSAACPIESSTRPNKRNATTLEDIKGKGIPIDKSNKLLNENNKKNTTPGLSIAETLLMELEKAMGCKFIPKVKGISTAKTQTKSNKMQKTKKGGDSFTKEARKRTEVCFGSEREIQEQSLAKKAKTVETEREHLYRGQCGYAHDHAKCLEERERKRSGWFWEEEEDVEWEEDSPWWRFPCETPTSEDEDDSDAERVMPKRDLVTVD